MKRDAALQEPLFDPGDMKMRDLDGQTLHESLIPSKNLFRGDFSSQREIRLSRLSQDRRVSGAAALNGATAKRGMVSGARAILPREVILAGALFRDGHSC